MSRTVFILGDTVEAWATGLYVRRVLDKLVDNVVIAPSAEHRTSEPSALVAPPRTKRFFSSLGLTEEILFREAGASFLLGAEIRAQETFTLAYGQYGVPANSVPFHHFWMRMMDVDAAAAFDHYSFGAELARSGRFVHPSPDPKRIESSFDYGYTLEGTAFGACLRAQALSAGVMQASAQDIEEVSPWLVLDCTGRESRGNWVSWPDLPESFSVDEEVSEEPSGNLSVYTVQRFADGVSICLHPRKPTVTRRLGISAGGECRTGRSEAPWRGNAVSLGGSACQLPGLHSPQFLLLHAQLDLLASLLPAENVAVDVVAAEYNRRATRMMDNVADFDALALTSLKKAGLRRYSAPSLARKAEQFVSRGRPVTYDDELYSEQDWIAAFIGAGFLPERVSPLALAAPLEAVERNYEGLRKAIAQAASRLPDQQQYLDHLLSMQQGAPNAV